MQPAENNIYVRLKESPNKKLVEQLLRFAQENGFTRGDVMDACLMMIQLQHHLLTDYDARDMEEKLEAWLYLLKTKNRVIVTPTR